MRGYCNKCDELIEELNDNEEEELKNEGGFVCSDCINKEMDCEMRKKYPSWIKQNRQKLMYNELSSKNKRLLTAYVNKSKLKKYLKRK